MTDPDGLRLNVSIRTCRMLARQILQRAATENDVDTHQLASLLMDNLDLIKPPHIGDNGNVIPFRRGGR